MKSIVLTITGLIAFMLSVPFSGLAQDSTTVKNPHQIGFNASKFIVLLNEQTNSLDLNYRWNVPQKLTSLRFGISYEQNTADDGMFSGSIKLGIDKYFKKEEKWSFYYGVDAFVSRSVINSSQRTTVRYGGFVFLGIMYHIGDHFSISTEPNLSLLRVRMRDEDSFDPEANREFFTSNIGNIGQIQINFHF